MARVSTRYNLRNLQHLHASESHSLVYQLSLQARHQSRMSRATAFLVCSRKAAMAHHNRVLKVLSIQPCVRIGPCCLVAVVRTRCSSRLPLQILLRLRQRRLHLRTGFVAVATVHVIAADMAIVMSVEDMLACLRNASAAKVTDLC